MKKTIILSFILGFIFTCQAHSQTYDIAVLKKQITQLKSQNMQLQKNVNALKANSKAEDENIKATLKSLETQLKNTTDSLEFYKKVAKGGRNIAFIALKSLRHRKTLFIWGAVIAIVLAGGIGFLIRKKYISDLKKQDSKVNEGLKSMESELMKAKGEMLSQINTTNSSLEQKVKDLEKKIGELKK